MAELAQAIEQRQMTPHVPNLRQVSYPREQFFKFMFLPSKVEVQYQPKKRRHCPP
jgi:hypothetical protein